MWRTRLCACNQTTCCKHLGFGAICTMLTATMDSGSGGRFIPWSRCLGPIAIRVRNAKESFTTFPNYSQLPLFFTNFAIELKIHYYFDSTRGDMVILSTEERNAVPKSILDTDLYKVSALQGRRFFTKYSELAPLQHNMRVMYRGG